MQKGFLFAVTYLLVAIVPLNAAMGHEFIGLSNPGIPNFYFASTFVSADGTTVVGSIGSVGYRWTHEEGMVPLGSLPGSTNSVDVRAISGDGSVIVGVGAQRTPYRWTKETGPVALNFDGPAQGVSGDGTVVVGYERDGINSAFQAVYWTEETGTIGLGQVPGFTSSTAQGISSDGKVIVGSAYRAGTSEAFRWTAENGFESLGVGVAYAASADGAVIVGTGSSNQAFRWTESGGMIDLGTLPGTTSSGAGAVSSDGSIIVGGASSGDIRDPFVWDEIDGMRNFQDVLASDFGLAEALAGWDLRGITMDATGRVFAGHGRHNGILEPWVVYLDTPIVGDPTPAWKIDAHGDWSVPANWTGGAPNATGATALLGNVITQPRTLTLSAPVTLGRLDFNNTYSYTVAGAATLTLDATTGSAIVNVLSGSHTITTPVTLADNAVFTVTPAASNLAITGALNANGKSLTKAGAGSLTVNNVRAAGLSINGGTVAIALNSGASELSTSVLSTLSIAGDATPTARFDLTNNAAIVNYSGTSAAPTVRQQILAARGGPGLGKTWNGNGITSTVVAAANTSEPESRSLGYAENAALPLGPYTTFRGQPVDDTSLLIAYTRTGDANLDGLVNDDDVTIVGASYAPGVPQASWALGDFDYNGFVDDDDVTLLGAFYDPSASPLVTPSAMSAVTAVAVLEPNNLISAAVAVLLLIVFVARRRRQEAWANSTVLTIMLRNNLTKLACIVVFMSTSSATAGQLGAGLPWISDATPSAQLTLNNDDYQGAFDANPNRISVNSQGGFRQSIVNTERMVATLATGGITEYALTIGASYSDSDARPGVNLDSVFQVQLGFGMGNNFVPASTVAPGLVFDQSSNVNPIIADYTAGLPGTIPILALIDHRGDTLIFQGSSTTGLLSDVNFSAGAVFKLPLDVPDLPSSARDFYSPQELQGLSAVDVPFTVRITPIPEPQSLLLGLAGVVTLVILCRRLRLLRPLLR